MMNVFFLYLHSQLQTPNSEHGNKVNYYRMFKYGTVAHPYRNRRKYKILLFTIGIDPTEMHKSNGHEARTLDFLAVFYFFFTLILSVLRSEL